MQHIIQRSFFTSIGEDSKDKLASNKGEAAQIVFSDLSINKVRSGKLLLGFISVWFVLIKSETVSQRLDLLIMNMIIQRKSHLK